MQSKNMQPNVYHSAQPYYTEVRGNRTYAQAARNSNVEKPQQHTYPITLNPNTFMRYWLKKGVLIGETHSLDHMANLHVLGIINEETKYLGGLKLAIHFRWSAEAKEYLEDKNRWQDWFKWLVMADQFDQDYERVAWLKITDVPLQLWEENNFSIIASRYGKVLNPFDGISNRRDYSMRKVGVFTSARRWINEEITVNSNGCEFKVGIVEYTDDWSPFKPAPFDKVDHSEEEDNNTKGISETWMEDEMEEPEEGEIRPVNTVKINAQPTNHQSSAAPAAATLSPATKSVNGGIEKSPTSAPLDPSYEKTCNVALTNLNAGTTYEVPNVDSRSNQECDSYIPINGPPVTYTFGPLENLVPLGCFGSFPNNTMPFSFTSQQTQNNELHSNSYSGGGPKHKKRKRGKVVFPSPRTSPLIQDYNSIPSISQIKSVAFNSSKGNMDSTLNLLNEGDVNFTNNTPRSTKEISHTSEVKDMVAIGNAIGFQIDANDPELVETEVDSEEKNGIQ
ncbi:unnamed protein product [Lactuca virosa]|uniref:DUF4283 domain-containing protein n=1 Tax=Lactuca virosa TaxID=75947 RepID=A0AAU9PEU6_9ASTR|nr:unnamed protein product [Lactuca virosa]